MAALAIWWDVISHGKIQGLAAMRLWLNHPFVPAVEAAKC
jgi:hypothetical protein